MSHHVAESAREVERSGVQTDPRDDLARLSPYLGEIHEAAGLEGEDTALLAAICLRETLAGWAPGYKPLGTHVGTGDWAPREWSAARLDRERELVTVIGEVRMQVKDRPGVYVTRFRVMPSDGRGWGRFLFQADWAGPYGHLPRECPAPSPFLQARWACWALRDARAQLAAWREHPLFARAVLSRYNASLERVRAGLEAGDPDIGTSHGDYGRDVAARRDRLRTRYPEIFPPDLPEVA